MEIHISGMLMPPTTASEIDSKMQKHNPIDAYMLKVIKYADFNLLPSLNAFISHFKLLRLYSV